MANQFTRLELLIGEESLKKLATKKVAVFGLGGVGGNVCDALVRSGVGNFFLLDNDEVDISNVNRQIIANMNTVGKAKVDVMEEHLRSINPNVKTEKKKCFYLPNIGDLLDFSEFDYVVDAIDTVTAKLDIIERCVKQNVPVISALGCGNKLDPTMLKISDISKTSYDPLARVMRRELKKRNIDHLKVVYSTEKAIEPNEKIEGHNGKVIPGSSAFVPPVAGIMIASEVVKDLLK